MKQLNPKSGTKKIGTSLGQKIDDFNEGQISQLYELYQETIKAPSTTGNDS
jgi:hypothetical protein